MDWSDVTRRVVIEAAAPHPEDVVLVIGGDWGVVSGLAPRVRRVVVSTGEERPVLRENVEVVAPSSPIHVPTGTSVVVLHDSLRRMPKPAQAALLDALGAALPRRALLVLGDVFWSVPFSAVDEPEQYGDDIASAPTVAELERWLRSAGFLPDVHRFGVGRAVCVALRS